LHLLGHVQAADLAIVAIIVERVKSDWDWLVLLLGWGGASTLLEW